MSFDQFDPVIDVFVSLRRDAIAARRFFQQAIRAGEPCPGCGRPYGGSRPDLPGLALQAVATGRESPALAPTVMEVAERVRARMLEELVAMGCAEWVSSGPVITDQGRRACSPTRTTTRRSRSLTVPVDFASSAGTV
jgi:hypothetical protein